MSAIFWRFRCGALLLVAGLLATPAAEAVPRRPGIRTHKRVRHHRRKARRPRARRIRKRSHRRRIGKKHRTRTHRKVRRRRVERVKGRRGSLRPFQRLRRYDRARSFKRLVHRKTRKARRARKPRVRLPAIPLYHLNNRESVRIRLYDTRGRLRAKAFRRFSRFMRCSHTGRAQKIHWRLLVVLYDLWIRFGQPQVTVFSGNRPKMVSALKTSRHISGHAIDFKFDTVSNKRVVDYLLKNYPKVGVGYYPNGFHVHLDVRSRKSHWIDYKHKGPEGRRHASRHTH